MKKTFVAVVLCMALLCSFTVSASAEFTSSDSSNLTEIMRQVQNIRNQLGYPPGGFSSLREAVNYIANHLPSSPKDYSTVLSNIKTNTDSLVSYIKLIEGDTNSITARCTELVNLVNTVNSSIGTAQIAITNHIDSASTRNHNDLTSFQQLFDIRFSPYLHANNPNGTFPYLASFFNRTSSEYGSFPFSWGDFLSTSYLSLSKDVEIFADDSGYRRTLYGLISQLQQVLASDDDLQLKKDNKNNEDAATDAFVNGSSSKTSLGTGDIGNLKDVGGTFNDLTSLNGQSSVTSFLNGLTSADGTGQGWFSEATRASLDAVSAPVTTTKLVRKTWRGEKSLTYSISADTSVNVVSSPAPARAPVVDSDPYNMSGFEDNYNWLWGDAS